LRVFVPEIVSKAIKKQANTTSNIQLNKSRFQGLLKGFCGCNLASKNEP